ncbi:WW domain-containing oxidoreductase isoform X4 [Hyalella azteca]|uniref:WW domain-containing oxidoreductase n=1 Tax=Hyalella azteca TaxID=294128 RepID=A0A8B7PAB7_HYAAZ|nr:WW domain-containing oxidoreductase isoform X3 [Hyalella azteca]XP_047739734.1 WW domain-containing oxidoreductase isoform X4 [Hyalella azteca]
MELPETDSEDELGPGWEERVTNDGQVFYAHHGLKATQWNHPRTGKTKVVSGVLPLGWEKIVENGGVKFIHKDSQRSTYVDPRLAFATEETSGLHNLRQRYDASSTGLQILHGQNLSGLKAIVTGANCGIGFETARSLAFHGCQVILACRHLKKANDAIKNILKQRPFAACHAMELDLSSLQSVKDFVTEYMKAHRSVNILILNAGTFGGGHQLTKDGIEETFQVNHLSHFYLCQLLLPTLRRDQARVVWLAAESHRFASLQDTEDVTERFLSPLRSERFSPILAYNNAKLCNILAAFEIHRNFGCHGVRSYAVHPGNLVSSGLTRHSWLYWCLHALLRPWTKSLQACAASVYCACSPDVAACGGVYVNGCLPCRPSPAAMDSVLALRLYNLDLRIIERTMGSVAFAVAS